MLPYIASLFTFIAGGAISIAVFWAMQRLRQPPATEGNKDFANSVAFRIGAIHALVLSLVFAGSLNIFLESEETLDLEVVAAGKLQLLYEHSGNDVRVALVKEYMVVVLEEGLGPQQIRMFGASDRILNELFAQIFVDLSKSMPGAATALELVATIYEKRTQRILDVEKPVLGLFWVVGILGFFLILYAMTVNARSVFGFEMIFIYGGVVASVLYLTFEMTTPFSNLIHVEPDGFYRLLGFYG